MTKSIFNQLNISSPFDKTYNLKDNVKIFGYVNDKKRWIIWSDEQTLYKSELERFTSLKYVNLNRIRLEELINIYPSETVINYYNGMYNDEYEDFRDIEVSCFLDKKEQNQIIEKQESITDFIEEVLEHQIFL